MPYRKVTKGHYTATVPRTFNDDIVIHLVKNSRATSYVGSESWQIIVDDSYINAEKKIIGTAGSYALAKKKAKTYIEMRLLSHIDRQLSFVE